MRLASVSAFSVDEQPAWCSLCCRNWIQARKRSRHRAWLQMSAFVVCRTIACPIASRLLSPARQIWPLKSSRRVIERPRCRRRCKRGCITACRLVWIVEPQTADSLHLPCRMAPSPCSRTGDVSKVRRLLPGFRLRARQALCVENSSPLHTVRLRAREYASPAISAIAPMHLASVSGLGLTLYALHPSAESTQPNRPARSSWPR